MRPTKKGWLVLKMWMAAHQPLSLQLPLILEPCWGRTGPWELSCPEASSYAPQESASPRPQESIYSKATAPAVYMHLGQCLLLPGWVLNTMCPELTQVAPSTSSTKRSHWAGWGSVLLLMSQVQDHQSSTPVQYWQKSVTPNTTSLRSTSRETEWLEVWLNW